MPTLRTLPRLFCMPIFFLASWASFGQGRIDSLKALLNTEITFHEQVDVLLELSKECYSLNDSISIAFAKQALQTASRIKYFKGQKYAYTLLGQGLASSGKLHEAKSNFKRSHAVKSKQVSSLISYNLLEWGNTMTQLGAYDSSMLLYEQARKEPDLEMATLQILYANIAHVNVLLSQNARAFAYLDSAESLEYDDDAQMKILSVYGLIYQNLTDYDKANECYQRLNILANKRNDNYYKIECQLNFSRLAIMHGEFHDALTYSLEALALTNKYNRTQYVDVLIQTAEAYMELSQLEFTGQFLYQALKLSEESEMEHRVALIYNDLAWLNKIERKFEKAHDYANKAQALMEKINDKKGLSESCNIRGLTFLLQEKYDRAEAEYKKALALRQEIKTPKGISATLYNLADLYLEVERNQEAMILLYQVVEIERKIGNKPYLAMTYGLIARQLVRDKKYIEALSFLKKADEEGENDQSLFIKRDNARSYVFYYNAIKDYKNALAYQKEYQWLNDEIFERNGSDKIAQYEALYKIEKREKEIEILTEKQRNQEAKIQLQQSELVRKNTILVSIGVVLVLLIFIGIVGIKANRAKEEANQELQQLNRQVAEKGRIAEYNLLQVEQLKGDLELREKLYRDLVENASDIIHELDEEGRFTYVNHAAERITGYREEEIIGSHYSMFIHPDYSERVKSFISDQKAGRLEFSYQEFPILSKQGEIVWLGQSTRLFFDGNRVWKTAVVARDITKQKLAEERLKKSQHEYVEWLNTIPIGIYTIQTMTDGSFKFLYVSPRWCEMNGVSKESVLADSTVATALILPDDRASFVKANRKIRDHYSFEWEGRLIVKGEIRYMRIASRSKKLDDGTFLSTGYQLDITFQKANETDKVK